MDGAGYDAWSSLLLEEAQIAIENPQHAIDEITSIASRVTSSDLDDEHKAGLLFIGSSIIINAGSDLSNEEYLTAGRDMAERARSLTSPDQPLHFQCWYNATNATVALTDLKLPSGLGREVWEPVLIADRLKHLTALREVRRSYFEIAMSTVADRHTRSAAHCNLANTLDHSGRWAEAYDFYLRSLEVDPENGNAAGNLAELLAHRVRDGIGLPGHLAAVHDKYAALAKQLHQGTTRYAGRQVADRWGQIQRSGSVGHLSHGLDGAETPDLDYRRWVAGLRLALSPAVEGLGSDGMRWDNSMIETLYGESEAEMSPPILAEMNVLKSDFLVSRRLAYEGFTEITNGFEQPATDSGLYVETLDYSLYGMPYSRLLLAHRSALDVLDKTAVVANEYLSVGDDPSRVNFRRFWLTHDDHLRPALVKGPGRALPTLAMAELAIDMQADGMYVKAQDLRNAGTHRIVHAASLDPTGVTHDSRSRVDVDDLYASTTLALQLARSAFLYLIDLVAAWNDPADNEGLHIPFPTHIYLNDLTSADGESSP